MGQHVPPPRRPGALALALAAALVGVSCADAAAAASIYTCTDAHGKRLTSDRPIVECNAREQRLLNADGSVRRVLPPTLTADERAEIEATERRAATERMARQDAVRRDRTLLARFPDEAAHQRARAAALADVEKGVLLSQQRSAALARERKPLLEEAEFYQGRPLPLKLRLALDANDAGVEAQKALVQNQQAEAVRINALFDAELARQRRLWAGAAPGSLGTLPAVPAPTPASGAPAAPMRAAGRR